MLSRKAASLAVALTFLGLANANCIMENSLEDLEEAKGEPVSEAQCNTQAAGNYQFAMLASEHIVPSFGTGSHQNGAAGSTGFALYDSQCVPVGSFGPEGNDCGIPFEVDFFPDRPLVVTSINSDPADPFFAFDFDGSSYNSQDGKCGGCVKSSPDGLGAQGECKCGFYVGTCTLPNVESEPSTSIEYNEAICTPQLEGNYQVSLDSKWLTISIYDNECYSLATYRVGPEDLAAGCALPLNIDYFGEDNLINIWKLDLDATADNFNEDEAAFSFDFAGRSYGSKDAWCGGCEGQGSDDEDQQGCQCGIYVGE